MSIAKSKERHSNVGSEGKPHQVRSERRQWSGVMGDPLLSGDTGKFSFENCIMNKYYPAYDIPLNRHSIHLPEEDL